MNTCTLDKVIRFYLRDPNVGDLEAERMAALEGIPGVTLYDDSGPAEGQSVPLPRAIGSGTAIVDDLGGLVDRIAHLERVKADLLAACKAALSSITCAQPMRAARCKHGHGIDECDDCLVENLRSAIARAEGGGE